MSKSLDFLSAKPSFGDGFDPGSGKFMEPVIRVQFGDWQDIGEPDGDADLAALKSVRDQAEKQHRGMFETIVAVANDDDPSLNADGRLKVAAKILEPKLRVLAEVAEREFARANAAIEQEQAKVARAVRVADPLDIAVHSDIRAHLQRLDPSARTAVVTMAVHDGDVRTLQAIATAPAYLSGLKEDGAGQLYQRAQEALATRMAPNETRRISRLRQGLAMSAQAVSVLDRTAKKLIDFNKARTLIEREAKRA
jgi:hypothetical protein